MTRISKADKIREAKILLAEQGYMISSLWSVEDVQENYEVTDFVAMQILEEAIGNNESYIEHVFEEIDAVAERMNLTKKQDE